MTTIQPNDFGLDRALEPKDAIAKDRLVDRAFLREFFQC